jgi:hypothetical protein
VARAQIGPDKRGKTGHWLDSYVAYAEISEQTEWPVFSRYESKRGSTMALADWSPPLHLIEL